ncbi:putative transcriptional regulator YdeE [Bisgaardia hudsonensis]|uniref:Putative transcriptional regulator YdeE n=1 Tax=Bisgaardia hudsonensis TaxID=109472 RepID=A0A4R2N115_9PAST|nr:effector binding domain-containing protein [Bisgaardia hudsonensis]QLB13213.1 hypothetical protein A6A11_06100 [Bisgaardia hudsonensis]TCP13208.1 putative transcriptional regulator YdeE [Bisgaardia hudsonensis]
MSLTLYPIKTIRLTNRTAEQDLSKLWKSLNLPSDQILYGLYHHYESDYKGEYDFSIALEQQNKQANPIEIDDNNYWFEVFNTDREQIVETWKTIWNKSQQGLLKRAYSLDFEKYYPDEKVEIYISIQPHC